MNSSQTFLTFDKFPIESLCIFTLVLGLHYVVGNFLVSGGLGFFGKSLIGLSTNSLIFCLLISFRMDVAHIYLVVSLVLLFVVSIIFFGKTLSKMEIFAVLRSISWFVVVCLITNYVSSFQDRRLINAHWSYYFGLPAEMLKGTYPNRLRIFDNFPVEYPNFHFFSSSQLAILMKPLEKIDYLDFRLAKMFVLVLLLTVVYESLKINHISTLKFSHFFFGLLFASIFAAPNIYWAINTSNYSSGFFLLFFLLFFKLNKMRVAQIWILLFAITSARSVLPGMTIFFYTTIQYPFRILISKSSVFTKRNVMVLFFFVLIQMNIVFMFFSGPSNEESMSSLIRSQVQIPYQNFVNAGWLSIMSSGGSDYESSLLNGFQSLPRSTFFYWYFLVLISIWRVYKKNTKKKFIFLIAFLLLADISIYWLGDFVPKGTQLRFILESFLIPILIVLFLSSNRIRPYVIVFVVLSLIQLIVLPADLSVPNWALIEWLWISFLLWDLGQLGKGKLFLISLILGVWILFGSPSIRIYEWMQPSASDSTTHKIVSTSVLPSECSDRDLSLLVHSLQGNRVFHGSISSDRFSVTQNFLNSSQKLEMHTKCQG